MKRVLSGGLAYGLLCLLFSFSNASLKAQGFIDTTKGGVQEGDEYYGLDEGAALTKSGQEILEKFKKGRQSSNKDVASRFSGLLEFHDSNQDGVVDHFTGNSGGLEGRLLKLLGENAAKAKSDEDLEKIAEDYRKEQQRKDCKGLKTNDAANRDGKFTKCYTLSGVIVDDGSAHNDGPHRKYKLSDEAMEIVRQIGKEYGARTIDEAMKLYKEKYGRQMNATDKYAIIDLLRSEAAWLEEQKTTIYERQWKTLRAARLAGYDNPEDRAAGSMGADLMHRVESLIANGGTDDDVAKLIVHHSDVPNERMLYDGNSWVPESSLTPQQINTAQVKTENELKKAYGPNTQKTSITMGEMKQDQNKFKMDTQQVANLEKATLDAITNNPSPSQQKEYAKAKNCMHMNTWCHTPNTGNGNQKYEEVQGDPGVVFQDTRELIAISMQKIQTLPVNKIKDELKNIRADFNEQTDPAYFEELEKQIAAAKALRQTEIEEAKKAGIPDPKNYDLDTMSFRELSGIRQGLNQTYDDTYADNGLEDLAQKGVFNGPSSADGRAPGSTGPQLPDRPNNPFQFD